MEDPDPIGTAKAREAQLYERLEENAIVRRRERELMLGLPSNRHERRKRRALARRKP